jgi:hypothetical protein
VRKRKLWDSKLDFNPGMAKVRPWVTLSQSGEKGAVQIIGAHEWLQEPALLEKKLTNVTIYTHIYLHSVCFWLLQNILYFTFFFFFVGLGFELRTSCLQIRCCTAWAMPPVYFSVVILEMGFGNYLPGLALNWDPLNLPLPNSLDYRCEPPHLVYILLLVDLAEKLERISHSCI